MHGKRTGSGPLAALLLGLLLLGLAPMASAVDCNGGYRQYMYEQGTKEGRMDAEEGKTAKPHRHLRHMDVDEMQKRCYRDGYAIGYENASADMERGNDSYGEGVDCTGGYRQYMYEKGSTDGRADANAGKKAKPRRHLKHMDVDANQKACYKQGYRNGYKVTRAGG